MTDLHDGDLDAEEVHAGVGALVEPVQRAPVVVAEPRRNPDDGRGLESGRVHQQLTQMSVIRAFQLVLDDDDAAVEGLGLDVEPELPHRHLGRLQRQRHRELIGEDVEVLGQPRGEVAGLRGPHVTGVGHAMQSAQPLAVELHTALLPQRGVRRRLPRVSAPADVAQRCADLNR